MPDGDKTHWLSYKNDAGSGKGCRSLILKNLSGPVRRSLSYMNAILISPLALVLPPGFVHSLN